MRVLGMISGTSHDGIDIAIVDFVRSGARVSGRIEYTTSIPYSAGLRERLLKALPPARVGFDVACELDNAIGQEFANAAGRALVAHQNAGFEPVDLICSHGQTVFHWVQDGAARGTLQLGQPAWIAEATELPVVSDVRAADLAAGGQGAPLVPILDEVLLRPLADGGARVAALNIGGVSNVTVIAPGSEPVAWDIGPGNALIDAVVTASNETRDTFDRDGALASIGAINETLLADFLAEPYYRLSAPKTTGKELFNHNYVRAHIDRVGVTPALPELVATLTELTARTVADAVRGADVNDLIVSGGGVRNPALMRRIEQLLPEVHVRSSDAIGIPADDKEAIAFALIGWATANHLPSNLPSCTGARAVRVLGRITPGRNGRLPQAVMIGEWPNMSFAQVVGRKR